MVAFSHYFLQSAGPIRHHGSGGDAEALVASMRKRLSSEVTHIGEQLVVVRRPLARGWTSLQFARLPGQMTWTGLARTELPESRSWLPSEWPTIHPEWHIHE